MMNEYKTEKTDMGVNTAHPSYGTLRFSRLYGGGKTALFGSSIKHENTIAMDLYHADITRGLSNDWVHSNNLVARVEMSYSQFAEAITSFGNGTGIPCTIRYTEKDGQIPDCDFVSKRTQFTDEFKEKRKETTKEAQQLIQDVADLFSQKKALTKADKESVLKKLNKLSADLGCNMDYILDQFNEQMDKTVMEAKGEIEAFCQNKIQSIANAALVEHSDEFLKLKNPVGIDSLDNEEE